MKRIYFVALACLLTACASKETTDTGNLDLPPPAGMDSSAPPLLDPSEETSPEALATPVEPPPTENSPETFLAEPTPATEPESEPAPTASLPPPTPLGGTPVTAQSAPPPATRDIYEEYEEYRQKMDSQSTAETHLDRRSLFLHEGGAFQLGLDYAYKPFKDYDFDHTAARKLGDSTGGVISFTYFPLRSLSYGRFGLGLQGGVYWTKIEFTQTGSTEVDSSKKHSIDTYGGKAIYEFHYFLGQLVVPFAFYSYEQVRVRPFTIDRANIRYPSHSIALQSYGGGMHLNLNRLEPSVASRALASSGVKKFYLTYTLQQPSEAADARHFLGLRFEY